MKSEQELEAEKAVDDLMWAHIDSLIEFKYFDLEGLGFLNLRDFIRANEKIGVVLSNISEFQDIFNYFDTENTGVINYRKFCKNIF